MVAGSDNRSAAGFSRTGRLQIDDLCVDLGTHEVTRGDELLALPSLSYHLLVTLALEAPNVLSQDALVEKVWNGIVVSPETVTQRVKLLRQALGDDAKQPRYIGLVRGEGYRLLAEVTRVEPRSAASGAPVSGDGERMPSRPGLLAMAAVLAIFVVGFGWWQVRSNDATLDAPVKLPDNGVVVLPFVNASANPDDSYISEGIADELRDQLMRIPDLQVPARPSSIVFRSEPTDIRTIAQRLGVRWLIDGTLRRQNDRIVITVQVIDGVNGFGVRSRNFQRGLNNDTLGLQQDIANSVVEDLTMVSGLELVASEPLTEDVSAFELLLLARQLDQQVRDAALVDLEKLDRVIELYRDATTIDPDSALAQSRLASALLYRGDVDGAAGPIQRALDVDPNLSEVQHTLGSYLWRRGDSTAGDAFANAVDLNPNDVDALWDLAKWLWHLPSADEPSVYFRRGLEFDPLSLSRYADIGNYYGMVGKSSEALELAERVEELFSDSAAYVVLGRIYEVAGALDEAIAWATRARVSDPDMVEPVWQLGELYARIGDVAAARREEPEAGVGHLFFARRYDELIDVAEDRMLEDPDDLKVYYLLAFAHNVKGDHLLAEYILHQAGLPGTTLIVAPEASAVEALVTLADASLALGKVEVAHEYAQSIVDYTTAIFESGGERMWWAMTYQACANSILGRNELALRRLEELPSVAGFPWYPVLVDAPCFTKYADNERYREVVAAIDDRLRVQRERLPETLERHGLAGRSMTDHERPH